MSLIDWTPDQFEEISWNKLCKLDIIDKLKIFYDLSYPASTWFYHKVIGIGKEDELYLEDRIKFLKHLCINDLYYFSKYILNKNKLREKPNREMAENIMIRKTPDDQERKLLCEPRGTYKTTLGSISYPIWALCKNPNLSILIDSETDNQAQEIYSAAKEELESNLILHEIFGKFKSNTWNETKLNVKQRNIIRRDNSLNHSGVDCSRTGLHPDIIVVDDPCSDINTQTEEARNKVHNHYKLLTPLCDKKGHLLIICTRWHKDDLAGRIIDTEKDLFSVVSLKTCYGENGDSKDEADGLYAPEILTKKYLRNAQKNMGMYQFSSNYLNDPIPDTDKSFKREWLKYFDDSVPMRKNKEDKFEKVPLTIRMAIDASWADKTSNVGKDPTAMVIGGFADNGDVYILDIFNQRINPTEVIKKIFEYVEIYNLVSVASEDIGTQKGLNFLIEQEMVSKNKFFEIKRIKHQAQSKGSRIASLTPMFQEGKVYIRPNMSTFINQYMYFSPGNNLEHDDILDALEMLVSEYRFVGVNEENEEEFETQNYSVYDQITGRM